VTAGASRGRASAKAHHNGRRTEDGTVRTSEGRSVLAVSRAVVGVAGAAMMVVNERQGAAAVEVARPSVEVSDQTACGSMQRLHYKVRSVGELGAGGMGVGCGGEKEESSRPNIGGPGRLAGHVLPAGSKRRRAVRDGRAAGLRQVHGAETTRCSGHTYSDGREAAVELASGWS
jgi:hypothetical protein